MVDIDDSPVSTVPPAGPSAPPGPATSPASGDEQHESEVAEEEILLSVTSLREVADRLLEARWGVEGVADAAGAVQAVLSGVAAAVPLAVLSTDRYGVVSEANAAAGHLAITSFPRLRGKPFQVFVAPAQRRVVRTTVAQAWRTGRSRCRFLLVPRTGEPVEVDAVVMATGDAAGGHGGLQWMLAPCPVVDRAGTEGTAGEPGTPGALGSTTAVAAQVPDDVVHALAELCRLRPGTTGLQPMMGQVATLLVRAVPAADHVSITLGDPTAPVVTAADSEVAQRLDGVVHGDGPAVSAWSQGVTVTSPDLAAEDRWPRYTAAARTAGVGCLAAVPVLSGSEVIGVLTLFATLPDVLVADAALDRAAVFATAVAALIEQDRHVTELRATADQLQGALASRAVIEQAKGMVAAWTGCGVDDAFTALSRWSQDRNVKLREVAAFVVGAPDQARPLVLSRSSA